MKAIVIKKTSLERVKVLFRSEPMLVSSIVRVEEVSDCVYFSFDSDRDLSHASTVFYVAGILHRVSLR